MLRALKHFLLPHVGNGHHPYALRTAGIWSMTLLMLTGFMYAYSQEYSLNTAIARAATVQLVEAANAARTQVGLSTLTVDPFLQKAAQEKANDMAARGYFSHTGPDGSRAWDWMQKAGYSYTYAAENLAVNVRDFETLQDAWMKSVEHRENILSAKYSQVGVALAEGLYNGKPAVFVVEMFASPKAVPSERFLTLPNAASAAGSLQVLSASTSFETQAQFGGVVSKSPQLPPEKAPTYMERIRASPFSSLKYWILALVFLLMAALCISLMLDTRGRLMSHKAHAAAAIFCGACLLVLSAYMATPYIL